MFIDYLSWWYTRGLLRLLLYLRAFIIILADTFSVRIALTTFFKAWKKDATATRQLSLGQRWRVWGFNLLARGFGMVIKFFTLLVFLVVFSILLILEIFTLIFWLLLPILVGEALVLGILYLLAS